MSLICLGGRTSGSERNRARPEGHGIRGLCWHNPTRLTVGFFNGTLAEKRQVRAAIRDWTNVGIGISFQFHFNENEVSSCKIRIRFSDDHRSWAYIGTTANLIAEDQETVHFGDKLEKQTILHEFGHVLGMIHEHQAPQGSGNNLEFHEDVILNEMKGIWSEEEVRSNILYRPEAELLNGDTYDRDSIMHYCLHPHWIKKGPKLKENEELSGLDKKWVKRYYRPHMSPALLIISGLAIMAASFFLKSKK